MRTFLIAVGLAAQDFCARIGGIFLLFLSAVREFFIPPYELQPYVNEGFEIGARSLGVVLVLGTFGAMVLALQTGLTLNRFEGELYVGPLVTLSMFRELGPVIAGFMVASRAGSGIAAEIGAMKVTEQIDAMRACGGNPVRELVLPRIVASAIVLPLLAAMANAAGVIGGLIMSMMMLGLDFNFYMNSIPRSVRLADFFSGLSKTFLFGIIIASVSCYEGFHAAHGSLGVSRAATRSVVLTFILILIADVMLSALFVAIGGIYWV